MTNLRLGIVTNHNLRSSESRLCRFIDNLAVYGARGRLHNVLISGRRGDICRCCVLASDTYSGLFHQRSLLVNQNGGGRRVVALRRHLVRDRV
jgi:hypothetical protein